MVRVLAVSWILLLIMIGNNGKSQLSAIVELIFSAHIFYSQK